MHHDDCYDEDEYSREALEAQADERRTHFLQREDYRAAENRSIASEAFLILKRECARIEREHGFGKQSPGEDIALMHSELSEALEEIRSGRPLNETYYNFDKPTKPEGVPSELADVIIRVLGFCARHDVAIFDAIVEKMRYNESRPFKHGGKAF